MTAPRPAADVAAGVDLSPPAALLLTPGLGAEAFFDALVKAGHLADAARFAGPLLGVPKAVWWGALCARHSAPAGADAKLDATLKAAVEWLRAPDDLKRRAANAAGSEAPARSPARLLASAVFFSGGSLGPEKAPEAPAPPGAAAKFAALAVMAAARPGGEERLRDCLALAVEVHKGRNGWA